MRVEFDALTDEDLKGITRICALNPHGETPVEIVRKIAAQELSFWRLRDDKTDIRLVLKILVHRDGNELLIWGVFGRGLFEHLTRAVDFCKLIANKYFCQRITGEVYSKGLGRMYEKLGATKVFTKYQLEG